MRIRQDIGLKLRMKRAEIGLSQKELSRILKVSTVIISHWENGLFYPSRHLKEVNEFLNMSPEVVQVGVMGGLIGDALAQGSKDDRLIRSSQSPKLD